MLSFEHKASLQFQTNGPKTTLVVLTLSLSESNLESINVVVSFESVDETLVCDPSNKSYRAVLSSGTICFSDHFAK